MRKSMLLLCAFCMLIFGGFITQPAENVSKPEASSIPVQQSALEAQQFNPENYQQFVFGESLQLYIAIWETPFVIIPEYSGIYDLYTLVRDDTIDISILDLSSPVPTLIYNGQSDAILCDTIQLNADTPYLVIICVEAEGRGVVFDLIFMRPDLSGYQQFAFGESLQLYIAIWETPFVIIPEYSGIYDLYTLVRDDTIDISILDLSSPVPILIYSGQSDAILCDTIRLNADTPYLVTICVEAEGRGVVFDLLLS